MKKIVLILLFFSVLYAKENKMTIYGTVNADSIVINPIEKSLTIKIDIVLKKWILG